MSALKNLVTEIVDYAGLFPPAQLPLEQVVENYEEYLSGDFGWMLSRLVLPIGKLPEFERQSPFVQSEHRWKISALIPPVSDPGFEAAIQSLNGFNERYSPNNKAVIDNIEIKAPTIELVNKTAGSIPEGIAAFLEIPHAEYPTDHIKAIAAADQRNLFAKIRTGGVTEDLIPSATQVASFIVACAEHEVGMKATAGLHHPIRGSYRLTYADDPDCGTMFGFLNVFLAGCFAYAGHQNKEFIANVLSESDTSAFAVTEDGIQYQSHKISAQRIKEIRDTKLTTFGSCSFTEPTTELQQLGWLAKQETKTSTGS